MTLHLQPAHNFDHHKKTVPRVSRQLSHILRRKKPLARVEGQVAFATLFRRFPELRAGVPDEEIRWSGGSFLRGFTRLPVLF